MFINSHNLLQERLELLEGKTADTLVKTFNLNPELAQQLEELGGKLSVWLYKSLLKDSEDAGYDKGKLGYHMINAGKLTSNIYRIIKDRLASIKDWQIAKQREGVNIDLKTYTSFNKAYQDSKDWHDSLVAEDEVEFEYEGTKIIEYPPNNGVIFYWEDLETNNSKLESQRMGHCGHSPKSNTLYSLRSRRYVAEKGSWVGSSHITIGLNTNSSVTYQIKGKSNSKPKPEYHPYIVDLLIQRKEIKDFGTEYSPANDFKISDLDEDLKKKLRKTRSDLFQAIYILLTELIEKPKTSANTIINFIEKNKVEIQKDFTTLKSLTTYLEKKLSKSSISKKSKEKLSSILKDITIKKEWITGATISVLFKKNYQDKVERIIDNYWNIDYYKDLYGYDESYDIKNVIENNTLENIQENLTALINKYPWYFKDIDLDEVENDKDYILDIIRKKTDFEELKYIFYDHYIHRIERAWSNAYEKAITDILRNIKGIDSAEPSEDRVLITFSLGELSEMMEGLESVSEDDLKNNPINIIIEYLYYNDEYLSLNLPDYVNEGNTNENLFEDEIEDFFNYLENKILKEKFKDQPYLPGLKNNKDEI
jgi:hypothetical protein